VITLAQDLGERRHLAAGRSDLFDGGPSFLIRQRRITLQAELIATQGVLECLQLIGRGTLAQNRSMLLQSLQRNGRMPACGSQVGGILVRVELFLEAAHLQAVLQECRDDIAAIDPAFDAGQGQVLGQDQRNDEERHAGIGPADLAAQAVTHGCYSLQLEMLHYSTLSLVFSRRGVLDPRKALQAATCPCEQRLRSVQVLEK
jgi:hypothetical protein